MNPCNDVTNLLLRHAAGPGGPAEELASQINEELLRLTSCYLGAASNGAALQPLAVVHEAYARLVDFSRARWNDRAHFLALAARQFRRVLMDRDGERARIELSDIDGEGPTWTVQALRNALVQLERTDPRVARVLELRYFGGMTMDEVAQVLGVPRAQVQRDWDMARLWLNAQSVQSEMAAGHAS